MALKDTVLTNFQHMVSFLCTSMIYDMQSGNNHDSDTYVNLVAYTITFYLSKINIKNFEVNLDQKYTTVESINTGKIVGVVLNKV